MNRCFRSFQYTVSRAVSAETGQCGLKANGLAYLIAPAPGGAIMQYRGASFLWTICLLPGFALACAYVALGKAHQSIPQKAEKASVCASWGDD